MHYLFKNHFNITLPCIPNDLLPLDMGNLLNIRGSQKELRSMELFLFTEPSNGRDFRKLRAQHIYNETRFYVKRRKQSYINLCYYTCTGFRQANTKANDDHVELNGICKFTNYNFLCNLRIFTKSDCSLNRTRRCRSRYNACLLKAPTSANIMHLCP
jgi:hypothetical protein